MFGTLWENTAPGTECPFVFCGGSGPLLIAAKAPVIHKTHRRLDTSVAQAEVMCGMEYIGISLALIYTSM